MPAGHFDLGSSQTVPVSSVPVSAAGNYSSIVFIMAVSIIFEPEVNNVVFQVTVEIMGKCDRPPLAYQRISAVIVWFGEATIVFNIVI